VRQGMGVDLRDKGLVQVSMNLTNYQVTNIPAVYELSRRRPAGEASRWKLRDHRADPMTVLEGVVRHYIRCAPFSIRQVIEQRILESE